MLREVRAGVSEGRESQGTQAGTGAGVWGWEDKCLDGVGDVRASLAGPLAWTKAGRWDEQGR